MSIRDDLIADEGLRLKPYTDTMAKVTIGVGRNLSDNGISNAEAMLLLDNDIAAARADLNREFPWVAGRPDDVQRGLLNMCFNMGVHRLGEFKKMLAALHAGDFQTAADEAEHSAWATQVGSRAHRIAALFRGAK